jgi:hypothetical protein
MRILVRGKWRRLMCLQLSHNHIGVEGLMHLASNGWRDEMKVHMICNQDIHHNLLSYSMMINQNITKSQVLLKFPQTKMTVVFNKAST